MRPLSALGLNAPQRWTATLALVVALGVMSLVTLLVPVVGALLTYLPALASSRPWTTVTYPFALTVGVGLAGPLFTLFLLLWIYQIGMTIESEQGRGRYLGVWTVATILPALLMLLTGAPLSGPTLPVGALTVIWAARRPTAMVSLFGILPIAARWIGVIAAIGIFGLYYSPARPFAAVLAVLPLGLAWAWAAEKLPFLPYAVSSKYKPSKAEAQREIDFMKEVNKRKDERAEKERLRKLLEGGDDLISR